MISSHYHAVVCTPDSALELRIDQTWPSPEASVHIRFPFMKPSVPNDNNPDAPFPQCGRCRELEPLIQGCEQFMPRHFNQPLRRSSAETTFDRSIMQALTSSLHMLKSTKKSSKFPSIFTCLHMGGHTCTRRPLHSQLLRKGSAKTAR